MYIRGVSPITNMHLQMTTQTKKENTVSGASELNPKQLLPELEPIS
jgi:hypothetical protein